MGWELLTGWHRGHIPIDLGELIAREVFVLLQVVVLAKHIMFLYIDIADYHVTASVYFTHCRHCYIVWHWLQPIRIFLGRKLVFFYQIVA